MQQTLFVVLALAGLGCLAASYYYRRRRRQKLRERSRSLFISSLGLLAAAALIGWW